MRGPADSEQSQPFRKAVSDAYVPLQTAQSNYTDAITIRRDIDDSLNLDGVVTVRKAGLDYAAAVHRYSDAVMAWVSYTDRHLPTVKKQSRRKTATA